MCFMHDVTFIFILMYILQESLIVILESFPSRIGLPRSKDEINFNIREVL